MDYSFMKTGFDMTGGNTTDDSLVKAFSCIFLTFTEHGLKHAGKYAIANDRKVVSVDDIKRGMKYEVFKFMDRHDNLENIQRWREILEEESSSSSPDISDGETDLSDSEIDISDGEEDISDGETDLSDGEDVLEYNSIANKEEVFVNNGITEDFIKEMNNIDERWSSWEPQNEIERSLQKRINEMQ